MTPIISYQFDVPSIYIDEMFYFPNDIKASEVRPEKPYEIQVVYYDGKWRQDTFYITEDRKNYIVESFNKLIQ